MLLVMAVWGSSSMYKGENSMSVLWLFNVEIPELPVALTASEVQEHSIKNFAS